MAQRLACGLATAGRWQPFATQRAPPGQNFGGIAPPLRRVNQRQGGREPSRAGGVGVVNSKVEGESAAEARTSTPPGEPGPSHASDAAPPEAKPGLQDIETEEETESKGEVVAAWALAAVVFGSSVGYFMGAPKAEEFFAGYLLEQSLSVDNLFVFILVFRYFKVKPEQQEVVLNYGIWTAAILRGVMTLAGVELVDNFKPALLLFAGVLVYSSYGILAGGEEEEEAEDLEDNSIVKFCRRFITVGGSYDGSNFFTVENGQRVATPLLLVLAVVELSDVVFAVDSIPAVFGVTVDPFIVYTSNMFAIANLRALYKFISVVMDDLRFLDKSVAIVLGYIGLKMVADFAGYETPTNISLGIVASVLAGGVALSYVLPDKKEG
eukprot:jgi/Tetstr1/457438/TSEL_044023.t1